MSDDIFKGVRRHFCESDRAFHPLFCVSRRPRLVLPGIAHHVTQRGNNRQNVFFCDQDRVRYMQILRRHSRRHDLRILGWCLMTNHVHLIAIPGAPESLAQTLGHAHSQYSLEQNRDRHRVGHLWHNRYFSCPLDPAHLFAALRYVDLNPVRAGIIAEAPDWRWSSASAHTSPTPHDEFLDWPWIDWMEDARLGRWSYSDWLSSLLVADPPDELDRMRRATKLGEPLGSDEFIGNLEAKIGRRLRVKSRGRPPNNVV
ncbi:MAG TPA: transposase [Bryobacteraceae bacterium]|nr:transposase [Bryobacteraceae bacterium]